MNVLTKRHLNRRVTPQLHKDQGWLLWQPVSTFCRCILSRANSNCALSVPKARETDLSSFAISFADLIVG
jgi:hypothetical protein